MKNQSKRYRVIVWLGRFAFIGLVCGALGLGALLLWATTLDLPDFSLFAERKVAQSTKIYDRRGVLLYDVFKDIRRTIVPFDEINTNIKNASVAIEDVQFYQHHGIRPLAILRAVWTNFRTGRKTQGGSTITQQVIKNTLLTNEKTYTRKLKEWILAVKLDSAFSKEEILGLYLNESPYGGTLYGVEEASEGFFGKHAKDVSLAEAAYLAALPQAPSYYSPYGNHRKDLDARKNTVLARMRDLGFITKEEYDIAKVEEVVFVPSQDKNIKAPHFVMFIRDQLVAKYGDNALTEAGLRVTTSLDYELQKQGEELVSKYVDENEKRFNSGNGALVAIDPKTGQILVMVGSRNYFDITHDGNFNIATAKRQPGSSFKPFVYAKAFESGYTPETVVFDLPTQFNANCDAFGNPSSPEIDKSVCYMPENYDRVFRGPITFRDALAQSVNIPAIKALYLAGVTPSIEFAQRMGIEGLKNKNQYGLTLVLGGGEVSLLDMVSAYGVFANEGKRNPYQGILKIEDADGNVLEEYTKNEKEVVAADITRQITSILSDNAARAPAFGIDSYLNVPKHSVAVKTGTTNDYRDVWIVGYTPSLAVGAWMGNNDNTPMQKKVAGFIVAPMWNAFMNLALKDKEDEPFTPPEPAPTGLKPVLRNVWLGGQTFTIDKLSQKLATALTPPEMLEEKIIPDVHEILHWVDKTNPRGPIPQNPSEDPQYWLWETPVRVWATGQNLEQKFSVTLPTAYDNIHREENSPIVRILNPGTSTPVLPYEKIFIQTSIGGLFSPKSADYFLNGSFLGTTQAPFTFSFIPNETSSMVFGTNTLRVLVTDMVGNKGEGNIDFMVTVPSIP